MQLMKKDINQQQYKGMFFLPENPEVKLNGTLTIIEDNTGWLELFGAFQSHNFFSRRSLFTMFGVLMNGDKISLLDSYRENGIHQKAGSIQNYSAGTVIVGTHIYTREDVFFNSISAEIDHLQEWIDIDGGELRFTNDLKTIDFNYKVPASIDFAINNTLSGRIYFKNEFWVHLPFKNDFQQKTRIEFQSTEEVSAGFLIQKLIGFRKLLSFFVGQKLKILKIVLTSEHEEIELISPSPNVKRQPTQIEVHFNDHENYTPLPDRPIHLVKYEDIANDFELVVKNWFETLETELLPITNILLDGLADHLHFEENDFIKAWQGVEAFHRRVLQDVTTLKALQKERMAKLENLVTDSGLMDWLTGALQFSYEMPAKQRLLSIIKNHADILEINPDDERIDIWVKEMGNTRNYLTHFDPAGKRKKISGKKLYNYTCLLKLLLLILILKRLGVSENLLKNIKNHQNFDIRPLLTEQ
jgi:hypothetical protein